MIMWLFLSVWTVNKTNRETAKMKYIQIERCRLHFYFKINVRFAAGPTV